MNSRQLVIDALAGRQVPRVPRGPLAVHFCAVDMGMTIHDYSTHADRLAESILRYHATYRPDAVWVSADTWVTAEAMGAKIVVPGPDEPFAGRNEGTVFSNRDIENIPPPDPTSQGRQPILLAALRQVKRALGDDVFVVGCMDQAPFSLACALGGIENVMTQAIAGTGFVEALIDRCVDYAVCYGQAMAECGADMLSTGDSPAGLVGPDLYRSLCLPAEQRLFAALRESTACTLSLHICGAATRILSDMADSGADVLEIDQHVAMATACQRVSEKIALWGNIDPVGVLLHGTPQRVLAASDAVLQDVAASRRTRFVLSSGCTLAPRTPARNLEALIRGRES